MAVSLNVPYGGDAPPRWDTAANVAGDVLPMVLVADAGFALNVNVPNCDLGDVRGIRRATLTTFGVFQMTMLEQGHGYVRMSLEQSGVDLEPGTDEAWLIDGYVSVTPSAPPARPTTSPCPASPIRSASTALIRDFLS
jgi:5'-nucleotidase